MKINNLFKYCGDDGSDTNVNPGSYPTVSSTSVNRQNEDIEAVCYRIVEMCQILIIHQITETCTNNIM